MFDPRTIQIGDRIAYRDEAAETDDRAWHDAEQFLRFDRSMYLYDDGSGYVVCWLYGVDGSRFHWPCTDPVQPPSAYPQDAPGYDADRSYPSYGLPHFLIGQRRETA